MLGLWRLLCLCPPRHKDCLSFDGAPVAGVAVLLPAIIKTSSDDEDVGDGGVVGESGTTIVNAGATTNGDAAACGVVAVTGATP